MQPAGGYPQREARWEDPETSLKPWMFRCSAQDSPRVRTLVGLEDPTVSHKGSVGSGAGV